MNCQCGSDRILGVNAKCSDMSFVNYKDKEHDGYVPFKLNIGGGDYIEFNLCMACGRVQNNFPVDENIILENM
jgi:hypothetical protein